MKKQKIVFVLKSRQWFQRELLNSIYNMAEIKQFACMNCALEYIEKNTKPSLLIFGNGHDGCEKHPDKTPCFDLYLNVIKKNEAYNNISILIYPAMTTIKRQLMRRCDRYVTLGVRSFALATTIVENILKSRIQ